MRETGQIPDALDAPDQDTANLPEHMLRLLGEPMWVGPAGRCPIQSRKGLALLCYLASQPRAEISRRQLGALLWGDFHRGQAASNLATTLSRLKRQAPLWPLREHGEYLWWDPDAGVGTDLVRLNHHASGGPPEDMDPANLAALIRGQFLAGVDLDDAPRFSAWLAEERRRWHRRCLDVLWDAAAEARGRADWAVVLDLSRRALALDGLAERFVRATMLAHAALGDRAACQEVYDQLTARLASQLLADPEPDTTRLLESLLRGDAVLDARPQMALSPRAEARSTLPWIERRGLARQILEHAAGGAAGPVLYVSGHVGVGKTRLVREALAGARVLWADAGGPSARDPQFPWNEWTPSTTWAGRPDTGNRAPHVAALAAASPNDGRPLVLVLDHADRLTGTAAADLFSAVARWNPDNIRLVVVTDGSRLPQSSQVGGGGDESAQPRVDVPPFTPGELSRLLEMWSQRPAGTPGSDRGRRAAAAFGDPVVVADLMADTAGVALLIEAELGGQAARDSARRRIAGWTSGWPLLVRRVFEAAAGAGLPVKWLWEESPALQHRILDAVDRAVASGWLEEEDRDGETWLVWRAPVFGDMLLEGMSGSRREYWRSWRRLRAASLRQ